MSIPGEGCQYCGHNDFRMSDDSARLGVEIRVCNSCNLLFDKESAEKAHAEHVNSCFEEGHDIDGDFGEKVDWI